MGYRKFFVFWLRELIKQKKYVTTAKNMLQLLPLALSELSSAKTYWRHRHRYTNGGGLNVANLNLPASPLLNLNNNENQLWQRQLHDITQFSLPTLLRYEDRSAMANSVESRLPFMDHKLVEIGLALPENLKLRGGFGKWPIRKIMQDKIPDQIRWARYKRGFDIPLMSLLKSGLGSSIRSTLNANKHVINDYLGANTNINDAFSDQAFIHKQSSMAEAITLLWLNKVLV